MDGAFRAFNSPQIFRTFTLVTPCGVPESNTTTLCQLSLSCFAQSFFLTDVEYMSVSVIPKCIFDRILAFFPISVQLCVFFFLIRGKGDYFRLGHGTDSHVRKPQLVEGLKGYKIVDVAVGALHCLAVTEEGKVSQIKKKMTINGLWN